MLRYAVSKMTTSFFLICLLVHMRALVLRLSIVWIEIITEWNTVQQDNFCQLPDVEWLRLPYSIIEVESVGGGKVSCLHINAEERQMFRVEL